MHGQFEALRKRQAADRARTAWEQRDVDERRKYARERKRTWLYGITPEQFDQMLADQGGKCAICDSAHHKGNGWCVDHDHSCCEGKRSCGKCIRGLLCHSCNTGLGMFKDNPDLLLMAGIYLTHQSQHV